MIPAAATLATLAREAAEDVFDAETADCSEPMRLERKTTMPHPDPYPKHPRYTPVLVAGGAPLDIEIPEPPPGADPNCPECHGDGETIVPTICACKRCFPTPPLPHAAADTAAEAGGWLAELDAAYDALNAAVDRAEAAEAERDRLRGELAAVRTEAERARSLLPYPGVLDEAGNIVRRAGYGPMADSLQTWGACIRGFYEREARGE